MSRPHQLPSGMPPTPADEPGTEKKLSGSATSVDGSAFPHGFMASTAGPRNTSHGDIIDTPITPSSSSAVSRFEFEAGKGKEGTKVLLVEWDTMVSEAHRTPTTAAPTNSADGDTVAHDTPQWSVDWDGKADYNVLPVDGSDDVDLAPSVAGAGNMTAFRRVYFLLPPGAQIPPLVNITLAQGDAKEESERVVLWTKPMPAIFPESLSPGGGSTGRLGRRGVLHTLWAKRRLADLAAEIEAEMKTNSESIGLEMALQERDWICEHFGVGTASGVVHDSPSEHYLPYHLRHHHQDSSQGAPSSPSSLGSSTALEAKARPPIGGKLGEKLKGLKLATSIAELVAPAAPTHAANAPRPFGSHMQHHAPHDSLDAVLRGEAGNPTGATDTGLSGAAGDGEDELFALPLSPRSPEMAKSPFSLL